jgi:drug/metabolite transporter (DMT)-like permease
LNADDKLGVRYMVLAMTCFVINDSLVKFASQTLPSGVLIFVRGLFATALVLLALHWTRTGLHRQQLFSGPVLLRALVDGLAAFAYLLSMFQLPLANATAINMAAPLVVSLLAWLWLGEQVTRVQWLAIASGFAGVLLVIQPRSDGFNAMAWLCLLGTVLHALRDLLVRRIPAAVPSLVVTLATAAMVTVMAGALSLAQGWQQPSAGQFANLAAAAAFLAAGYHCVIKSTRLGNLSAVAPFRYSGLLVALLLGWAVWQDVPNALAWLGIATIVGSGLMLLHRQRQQQP